MSHLCHAIGCTTSVPPKMLMCRRHWAMVPRKTQITVWNEYRPGQEIDKRPSLAYLAIQQTAVGQVAEKEGKDEAAQACYRRAIEFIERARALGQDFRRPT